MYFFVNDDDETSLLLGHAFMGQLFYTPFNEHACNEVNMCDSLLCMFCLSLHLIPHDVSYAYIKQYTTG